MLQTTIGGRYKIVRQLGYGSFGETYLAQDLLLPEQDWCVVKKLQPQSEDEFVLQTARRLFEAEAKVLNMLGKHECIPTLLAHFEEQGQFYLVQEFIERESLEQEMGSGKWGNVPAVIDFLTDILRTLEFVHQQGVIHRDIKPANLIRRRQDQRIVLIDFGAVKQICTQVSPSSSLTVAVGTEGCMPNEQANGKPKPCSDIYAVGMIAIQALTNVPPHQIPEHPETGEVNWHDYAVVSEDLVWILDKMVRCDFRQRYQTAGEVLRDLQEWRSPPSTPRVVSPTPSQRTPPNKRRNLLLVGGVLATMATVALVVIGVNRPTPKVEEKATEKKLDPIPNVEQVQVQGIPTPPIKGSGHIYPFVSTRLLTKEDLIGRTNLELDLMLNEVLASHGSRFEDAQLQNYFSLQSWYVPRYSSKDFPKDLLSATEVSNMELIRDFKQQRIEKRKQNPDRCLVGVCIVSDLEAPLAVRSLPSANSTVVSKLDNGARVRVVQETNGWLQIDQPLAGWVIASRTEPICQD
jgi:serine/threonine protein kinase